MTDLPGYLFVVILILIVLVPIGLAYLLKYFQRKDSIEDIRSLVSMIVTVPRDGQRRSDQSSEPVKDFKDLIAPMEQFYSALGK